MFTGGIPQHPPIELLAPKERLQRWQRSNAEGPLANGPDRPIPPELLQQLEGERFEEPVHVDGGVP